MSWGPEPATQNLGAGFGERTEHQVTSTPFDLATEEPLCVAVIYYDDLAGLRAQGIKISDEQKTIGRLPNPFPKSDGCEPPAGWEKTCEPRLSAWVVEAMQQLMKRRVPVEVIHIPRRFKSDIHAHNPRYIFGVKYDFCDGDEIIAESSEEFGRQTARVETR